jgi:hypothetical protein
VGQSEAICRKNALIKHYVPSDRHSQKYRREEEYRVERFEEAPSHRLAEVTAAFVALNSHGHHEATVRVCRHVERPNSFYAVAAIEKMFRFRPSIAGGYATEDIDVFRTATSRCTFASEERAAAAAMASVARRQKLRWARLVRWLEFGPYACPGDTPWYFTAGIYKNLKGPASFFPIVRRREPYKLRATPAGKEMIVDVCDTSSFDPEAHTRRTAKGVEAALTKHFAQFTALTPSKPSQRTLRRTVELLPRSAADPAFVIKFFDATDRHESSYSVFRRCRKDLTTAFTYKPTSAIIETLEPVLAHERVASASPAAALKAAIAAIQKL